jgi:PAS domain S-box-containing protein
MSRKKNQVPPSSQTVNSGRGPIYDPAATASWLAAIVESADDAIISKTLNGIITSWNTGAERIFGYTPEEAIGQSVLMLIPPDHHNEEPAIIDRIKKGDKIDHYETVRLTKEGRLIDISLTVSPIRGEDDTIIGASKVARDITAWRHAEKRLEEQAETLETINRLGRTLSAELDQERLVQGITDAATELSGAQFGAFFYNVHNVQGGSYLLYSLSGVPREAFENFPMPRATEVFGPTFKGEGTFRSDNIKKDPRYGKNSPYNGMPKGHLPVTSYLAVPVVARSGDVIGGLFFGHPEPGVFNERHERIIEGLAAQAAIAMDNARLYERSQTAIQEREELLQREQEARKMAEVANRSKDEFLSLLSHELRTPLNAILGWSRMLESGPLEPEVFARGVETINRSAKLQARLIEDMLDISRIISGKLRLDAQPVDLTAVINSAVETLRPAADAKEIRVYVVLDFGAGTILGDPVRLQQVVWNLLSNAIKFTQKSGSVRVSLERINSHIELSVSDTGPGIDEDFLPYVFDRFRQGDASSSKKFAGLGLGLAIVRQLVELHGGTVQASNRTEENGALFTVKLPVMAVRQQTESALEGRVHPTAPAHNFTIECPPGLENIKVLAVDDEPDARLLLTAMLEQCGAEVRTCESAAEALVQIREFQPDILVSDIGLPEEDGYALIRRLRAAEAGTGKRLPAIALTAFARTEDRLQALASGYNMHVPKPVEPAELLLVIASLVSQNKFQ